MSIYGVNTDINYTAQFIISLLRQQKKKKSLNISFKCIICLKGSFHINDKNIYSLTYLW